MSHVVISQIIGRVLKLTVSNIKQLKIAENLTDL